MRNLSLSLSLSLSDQVHATHGPIFLEVSIHLCNKQTTNLRTTDPRRGEFTLGDPKSMRYLWGSGRESFQEWACFCSWGNYGVLPLIGLSLDLS